jgi:acetyltransferase-like isoleucine patch superfamily enzyme
MRNAALSTVITSGLFLLSGCVEGGNGLDKVNGSVNVEAGRHVGDAGTVNGSITIGHDAVVANAETVNGSIELGPHAHANSLQTVNGRIEIQTGAVVDHAASTVNGSLHLDTDSHVGGKLSNVNGDIQLDHAIVDGGVLTTGGDITIGAGSTVHGGLHVEKPGRSLWNNDKRKPKIVIGPAAVVEGPLQFDREVDLLVAPSAKIGPVSGAKPQPYSGQTP